MKRMTRGLTLAVGAAMLLQMQGCYGKFALTRKLYTWNGSLGDKWINSLATFAMVVIPVYGAAGFVDYVILNTIEFWTGKNPVTLKTGEKDVKVVEYQGRKFQLTATPNRLEVVPMDGKSAPASLVFDPATHTWSAESASGNARLFEMVGPDGTVANLIYPDGHKERVELPLE
jgi:hypothetical protein